MATDRALPPSFHASFIDDDDKAAPLPVVHTPARPARGVKRKMETGLCVRCGDRRYRIAGGTPREGTACCGECWVASRDVPVLSQISSLRNNTVRDPEKTRRMLRIRLAAEETARVLSGEVPATEAQPYFCSSVAYYPNGVGLSCEAATAVIDACRYMKNELAGIWGYDSQEALLSSVLPFLSYSARFRVILQKLARFAPTAFLLIDEVEKMKSFVEYWLKSE